MIGALIIQIFCYILILKGVPSWLDAILSCVSVISAVTALIIWEETKSRIQALENKIAKKGDVE